MRPVTSAAKPAEPSCAVSTKSTPPFAHRLHQRQHVAAWDAEAAVDARGLERRNDEVGVVHVSYAT
jgi:hypothetical protein